MSIENELKRLDEMKRLAAGLGHLPDVAGASAALGRVPDISLASSGLTDLSGAAAAASAIRDMDLSARATAIAAGLSHLSGVAGASAALGRLPDGRLASPGLTDLAGAAAAASAIRDMDLSARATAMAAGLSPGLGFASSQLDGLSEQMKAALGPSLMANETASSRLADQLKSIGAGLGGLSAAEKIAAANRSDFAIGGPPSFADLDLPDLTAYGPLELENPIHETNERLAELSEHIGQMRDLAVSTAEMQRSLNDVAKTILTEFSKGAEASNKATKRALLVANISAGLSLAAILATVWSVLYQDDQSAKRDANAAVERTVQVDEQQRNTAALERLSTNMEAERTAAAKHAIPKPIAQALRK